MRKEKIIDCRGKTCEKCIFLPLYRKIGNALYICKKCEYKTLFAVTNIKKLNNKNKSNDLLEKSNILDKCKNCNYFSHKEGYKPHCHYKRVKKSPIIDDNFKCPKE